MLRNALQFLKQVRDDKRGNMLILVAASLVPIVGTLGLAVDAAQWLSWRRDLHSAADAGAIAGALALKNDVDASEKEIEDAVAKVLASNSQHTYVVEAIETPPSAGQFAGNDSMIRVVLSTSRPLPFSSLFLSNPPTIIVEAVAESSSEVPNCMIALDQLAVGLRISGSATVNMNCGMASNSNIDATASGSDSIRAGALSAVGSVNNSGGVTADTAIHSGAPPAKDPYAGVLSNPNQICSTTLTISGSANTISPGCYQGIRVQANARVTLLPGIYFIGRDGMQVGGNAQVIGNGVTLVFTDTNTTFDGRRVGTLSAQGTSNIQLTAPTSGLYSGVIIHQDSRLIPTPSNKMLVTGDNGSIFDGSIYSPKNSVTFSGNSSMTTDCLQIVANFINFEGSTKVKNSCPAGRGVASFSGEHFLRLRQ